jgi:kynureninase
LAAVVEQALLATSLQMDQMAVTQCFPRLLQLVVVVEEQKVVEHPVALVAEVAEIAEAQEIHLQPRLAKEQMAEVTDLDNTMRVMVAVVEVQVGQLVALAALTRVAVAVEQAHLKE